MNETLILLLGETPDDPIRWAFVGENDILEADTAANAAALSVIAERAGAARLVVCVLRGERATMRALPVPPKSAAQFRAAASMLLEDELAESLEQIHVATVRHNSGAGIALAVKKSDIETWVTTLTAVGLSPDVVTVDYALVPMFDGRALIIETPDRVFGVVGLRGFAIEKPLADTLMPALLNDEEVRKVIAFSEQRVAGLRGDVEIDQRGLMNPDALIGFFAEGVNNAPNLMQGAYRKRRDWRATAGPWRRAGLLAAASVAALMLVNVAGLVRDLRTADRLKQDTIALHETAFPDAADADPRAYARQVLGAGGGGRSFLKISNALAESLEGSSGVQIDRIRYNGARDEYSINLRFGDITQIETLKRMLEARGLQATETGSVRRTGNNAYLGELRVSAS
ncbi:type II secretion system protein GspL [Marinicaulis aureus]|uniref:Type II secretion system protein GspL n=1 Tax=Hyphococcus aureus TaxID=2666033 RepID=A0ABW1KXW3_9PROT